MGASGWIANRADGTVEAVFEGDPGAVTAMVEFCRRGPGHAEVTLLEVLVEEPLGEPPGFRIR